MDFSDTILQVVSIILGCAFTWLMTMFRRPLLYFRYYSIFRQSTLEFPNLSVMYNETPLNSPLWKMSYQLLTS